MDTTDATTAAGANSHERVSVLLPLPLAGAYDYRVEDKMVLADGDFVAVPLGSREVIGVVWGDATGEVEEAKSLVRTGRSPANEVFTAADVMQQDLADIVASCVGNLDFSGFEMSLAILDQQGVIDRLLTVDAAPLPADRTTLKLLEIPEIPCDNIGEILLHDITRCESSQDAAVDCFGLIDLQSRAAAALIK